MRSEPATKILSGNIANVPTATKGNTNVNADAKIENAPIVVAIAAISFA